MFQLDDGIADLLNPYLENLAPMLDMLAPILDIQYPSVRMRVRVNNNLYFTGH